MSQGILLAVVSPDPAPDGAAPAVDPSWRQVHWQHLIGWHGKPPELAWPNANHILKHGAATVPCAAAEGASMLL